MDKLCCCCEPDVPNITVQFNCACCKSHVEEREVKDEVDLNKADMKSLKEEEEEEEEESITTCCCFRRKRHAKPKKRKRQSSERDGAEA